MELESGSAEHNIRGVPTHGGSYVQYNIYGNFLGFKFSRLMFLFKINSNLNSCDIQFLILFFFFS